MRLGLIGGDENKIYMLGDTTDTIYQYDLIFN
jgi:hypothetical protein